jgi:hypothetical protein
VVIAVIVMVILPIVATPVCDIRAWQATPGA